MSQELHSCRGSTGKNLLPVPVFQAVYQGCAYHGWAGSGEVVFAFLGEAVC